MDLNQSTGVRDSFWRATKDRKEGKGGCEFDDDEIKEGLAEYLPSFADSLNQSSANAQALQATLGADRLKSLEVSFAPAQAAAPSTPVQSEASSSFDALSSKKRKRYDAAAHSASLMSKATRELDLQKKAMAAQLEEGREAVKEVPDSVETVIGKG